MVIIGVVVLGSVLLALATLTAVGSRRRGAHLPLASLAGACFPLTWVIWYVRDQRPFRRAGP